MRQILVISHFYPPLNRMGSSRPENWARHFSEKGFVTVLTSKKHDIHGPLNLDPTTSDNVNIKTIEYPFSFFLRIKTTVFCINKILKVIFFVQKILWVLKVIVMVFCDKKKYDIIVSSYSPISSLLIGYCVKSISMKSFWICDFRDLWFENPYVKLGVIKTAFAYFLQKYVFFLKCNLITTTSEPFASSLKRISGSTAVRVVYNGFDLDSYNTCMERVNGSNVLEVIHTGTVYTGKRNPKPFFMAIKSLLIRGNLMPSNFKLSFLGDRLGNIVPLAIEYDLECMLNTPGQIDRKMCFEAQKNADFLLLLSSNDPGIVPGKVFEYISANKPILGVGIEPDTVLGRLLLKTGTGIPLGDDVDAIVNVLDLYLAKKELPFFKPNKEEILIYSREYQFAKLWENVVVDSHE